MKKSIKRLGYQVNRKSGCRIPGIRIPGIRIPGVQNIRESVDQEIGGSGNQGISRYYK